MARDATRARGNARLRRYYERYAASYDGWMRHYDRVMLGDGSARGPVGARSSWRLTPG